MNLPSLIDSQAILRITEAWTQTITKQIEPAPFVPRAHFSAISNFEERITEPSDESDRPRFSLGPDDGLQLAHQRRRIERLAFSIGICGKRVMNQSHA